MPFITNITEAEESAFELEFAEAIRAGFPSPAADHAGERIDIVHELNPHPATTFYARVDGDSMRDAGILDGDIIVIDRSLQPKNGDFIVAYIDGEYTLKEFRIDESIHGAWLIPHNPDYRPIPVTDENRFEIWGIVTHAIHSTRR